MCPCHSHTFTCNTNNKIKQNSKPLQWCHYKNEVLTQADNGVAHVLDAETLCKASKDTLQKTFQRKFMTIYCLEFSTNKITNSEFVNLEGKAYSIQHVISIVQIG
jgi:hypothetical protein